MAAAPCRLPASPAPYSSARAAGGGRVVALTVLTFYNLCPCAPAPALAPASLAKKIKLAFTRFILQDFGLFDDSYNLQ